MEKYILNQRKSAISELKMPLSITENYYYDSTKGFDLETKSFSNSIEYIIKSDRNAVAEYKDYDSALKVINLLCNFIKSNEILFEAPLEDDLDTISSSLNDIGREDDEEVKVLKKALKRACMKISGDNEEESVEVYNHLISYAYANLDIEEG